MSPRSKDQLDQIREQSTRKIMQSALRLFGANGYESTSMSQVAKDAGISKGLIYNYFDSKESLIKALILDFNKEEAEMMQQVQHDDPHIMLKNIILKFFSELKDNYEQYRLISSLGLQINKFGFIHEMCVEKVNVFFSLFESLLADTGFDHPKQEAKLFAAILDGIGFQYIMLNQEYPVEEMKSYLINRYCKKRS